MHTWPRELDGHTLGGCGPGVGLVPGYTTHYVRDRDNINFGALKIKSVRTNALDTLIQRPTREWMLIKKGKK